MAPPKYHRQIIPDYRESTLMSTPTSTLTLRTAAGCKRTIFDPGYLACLHQSNVRLSFDGIERLTEDGIVTKAGRNMFQEAALRLLKCFLCRELFTI